MQHEGEPFGRGQRVEYDQGDDVATANLVRAAKAADVRHLVYISVIGADRIPVAWMRSKLAAEQSIETSGIPFTTLRAAQFHDLCLTVAEKVAKLPVLPSPGGLRLQPVDAREVAARLAELTLGESGRPALRVRIPGKVGRAYRAGGNLTLTSPTVGVRTWEDFLAERVGVDR